MRCLSDTEREKLLFHIKQKADLARRKGAKRAVVDEFIVLLLLNTGLRPAELCKLNIGDFVAGHGSNILRIRGDSPNASRTLVLTPEIAEHLRKFLKLCRKGARAEEPFFVSERGGRFSYMSLYSKIKRIGKEAKITNLIPSMLRATYVVGLYKKEQDLRFVQQKAGHASHRTTALYIAEGNQNNESERQLDVATHESTAESNGYIRRKKATKQVGKQAMDHSESVWFKRTGECVNCDACGKRIGATGGNKIDSGQTLCYDCLMELRSK
ncbi:MAG: tyrosine-type recombinase/integrase [Planctomycetota bacterium]|jgi:integrase